MKFTLLNNLDFWKEYKRLSQDSANNSRKLSLMELEMKDELFNLKDIIVSTSFSRFADGCIYDDLMSYANEGLADAIRRYDPKKGRFVPYAMTRVSGAIVDSIRESTMISRCYIDKKASIDSITDDYLRENMREIPDKVLAERMDIPRAKLDDIRRTVCLLHMVPLYGKVGRMSRKEYGEAMVIDTIPDYRYSAEAIANKDEESRMIMTAIGRLPAIHQRVIIYTLMGFKPIEIAEKERINTNNIHMRKMVACRRLQESSYKPDLSMHLCA